MRVSNHIKNLLMPFIAQTKKKTGWNTIKAVCRGQVIKTAPEQERIPTTGNDHRREF